MVGYRREAGSAELQEIPQSGIASGVVHFCAVLLRNGNVKVRRCPQLVSATTSLIVTTRKTGNCGGNRLLDIRFRVHSRHEHGFKLAAGQIHAAIQHAVKPARKSRGIGRRRRVQISDRVRCEKDR